MIKIRSMFLESEDNKCFLCYEMPKDTPRMSQEGYFITPAELEQRERAAFESGHRAKVREEYNSALIENGFVSAAGRYKDVDEAFNDYLNKQGGEND